MNKYIIRYTENNQPFIDDENYDKKLKCEECGKLIVNNNGLASHIRRAHQMTPKQYYDKFLKKENEGICPVCGKETTFWKLAIGYGKHCSVSCSNKDPIIQEKMNDTMLRNFGEDYKEIVKQNRLNGHNQKHKKIKKKKRVKKEKVERVKGYTYYKTEYDYSDKSIKDKRSKTNKKVIKIINDLGYYTRRQLIEKYQYSWLSLKLESYYINGHICFKKEDVEIIETYYKNNKGTSLFENDVLHFINSIYNGEIKTHDRKLIKPLELDILIPEKKFAIECNGIYYHSYPRKDRYYHKIKTDKCQEKGITLLHLSEYDWANKKEICKNLIYNFLHSEYLKDFELKEIGIEEFKNFIEIQTLDKTPHINNSNKLYKIEDCCIIILSKDIRVFSNLKFSLNIDILLKKLKCNKKILVNRTNNFNFENYVKVKTTEPTLNNYDNYKIFDEGFDIYERKMA